MKIKQKPIIKKELSKQPHIIQETKIEVIQKEAELDLIIISTFRHYGQDVQKTKRSKWFLGD